MIDQRKITLHVQKSKCDLTIELAPICDSKMFDKERKKNSEEKQACFILSVDISH